MGREIKIPKEVLEEYYLEEGMTIKETAKELGVSYTCVRNKLSKYNINKRKYTDRTKRPDKNVLEDLYWGEWLTLRKVAERLNVDHKTVKKWLDYYSIQTRNGGYLHKKPSKDQLYNLYHIKELTLKELSIKFGVTDETIRNWLISYDIERKSPFYSRKIIPKEDLNRLYIKERKSSIEIGKLLNVDNSTVLDWLKKYDIPIRNGEGINNPLWKGGYNEYRRKRSLAKGDWHKNKKEALKRDDYTCQSCGDNSKTPSVHHIKPVREGGTNELNNLVCLCKSCHHTLEAKSEEEQRKILNIDNIKAS
jgi:transposase